MNTKIKIAAAMATGLVAGATLVGAAFAAPRLMTNDTRASYVSMMGAYGSSTTTATPGLTAMYSFMDGYRSPDGSIDFGRMHADVASGTVTMPYGRGSGQAKHMSRTRSRSRSPLRGSGMMSGTSTTGGFATGSMMGSSY